mmetsp:Transcript_3477/g.12662  ORF Transcript_3477/g.12662 Transcript_3477/m.12662 type:complete len:233 (+) Transcript_3477:153-851(+)
MIFATFASRRSSRAITSGDACCTTEVAGDGAPYGPRPLADPGDVTPPVPPPPAIPIAAIDENMPAAAPAPPSWSPSEAMAAGDMESPRENARFESDSSAPSASSPLLSARPLAVMVQSSASSAATTRRASAMRRSFLVASSSDHGTRSCVFLSDSLSCVPHVQPASFFARAHDRCSCIASARTSASHTGSDSVSLMCNLSGLGTKVASTCRPPTLRRYVVFTVGATAVGEPM